MGKIDRLSLNRETVRELSQEDLAVAGGQITYRCITGWVGTICSGYNCPPNTTALLNTLSCTCKPLD